MNPRKKILFLPTLFLLLQIACSPTIHSSIQTPSTLDQILEKGILRVGTTGDYSPFTYRIEGSDNYTGIDIALAKDLGKSLGVEVQFVETTWGTLMEDLLADKFDMGMGGITITLERQKRAFFSQSFSSGGKVAIARDEDADIYTTIDAINRPEVRVIVNPGGTNEIFTRKNFPQANLILNEDNITIFQKIVDGEADVMVTDAIETLVQQMIHPELEAVNPDAPFNFFEKGYLLPRDHTFKGFVDQWVNLRHKDGTYQRIFDAELEKIRKRSEGK